MKKSRKESELNTVDSQIRGFETRLKYNKGDLAQTVSFIQYFLFLSAKNKTIHHNATFQIKQIADYEAETVTLQNELNKFDVGIYLSLNSSCFCLID